MTTELQQKQEARDTALRLRLRRFGLFLLVAGLLFLGASWVSGGGVYLVFFGALAGVLVAVGLGGILAGSERPLLRAVGWLLILAPVLNFIVRGIVKLILPDSPDAH